MKPLLTWISMLSTLALGSGFCPLDADEGMWLFNRLPLDTLEKRHGFRPDDEWALHIMRSSARISAGGSGSVVSKNGLVMTNHHVVSGMLAELSTEEADYVENGFQAKELDDELKCPGTEVDILWEIVDVTERVQSAAASSRGPGEAEKARRAEIAAIEKSSKDETGLHSEVVTLYRGGEYHLYRYKRYADVRMVFAPEVAAAFFGGDADNFEFPRYCLDVAFLRLYEDDKPIEAEHWLRWSKKGVEEGELTFVSGHPGRTQRLNTVDHLRYLRDIGYPSYLEILYRREIALQQFGLDGAEAERIARDDLFGVQNSRKALRGILAGLQDPAILEKKLASEAALKAFAAEAGGADGSATPGDWARITAAMQASPALRDPFVWLEQGRAFWSDLFGKARTALRLIEETAKPNAERLPEFRETAIPAIERRLYSPAPIYPELEVAKLTDSLTHFASKMGREHPLVQIALAGKSPADRAYELVSGTALLDIEARKSLVEGGKEGLEKSEDAMVQLALAIDVYGRNARRAYEDLVTSVRTEAYAKISKTAFAATGTSVYPDATFTLRLAFGVVKGWTEGGKNIAPFTQMAGAFEASEQAGNAEPYELPQSWLKSADKVAGDTRYNFVSTADIIGGNSGSPVINRAGEVVGLIFDGNIHGLVLDIAYTEEKARAVSVHADAIVEALRSIYGFDRILKELRPAS